jgi:hypothetical protein
MLLFHFLLLVGCLGNGAEAKAERYSPSVTVSGKNKKKIKNLSIGL